MPKTTKKKPLQRKPAGRKKEEAPVQSEAFRILSLALKVEEWARSHDSSLGDALEEAMREFLEKKQQDAITKMFENAPEDDEPFTDEDRAEAEEGWREYQQGLCRSWEEVRKELADGG